MHKNTLPDTISTSIPPIRKITFVTEPSVFDSSPFEVEIAIASVERYKTPGSDQIPAEFVQPGGEKLRSKIHKLISGSSLLLYQFTRRAIKLTVVINEGYHCNQLLTKFFYKYN
jgi:hypothetical protein